MPHRFNRLPPISLGSRPCGCSPGEVLCVCEAAPCQHPSLTVWTTGVSNPDRAPYARGSAPSPGGRPPWPRGAHTPSPDSTPQACQPPTPPGCPAPGCPSTAPPGVWPGPQGCLATLYAQSRPAMLPRRCLTATAGTSLVRGSGGGGARCRRPGWRFHPAGHRAAWSGGSPVPKIPHCCRWRGCFPPRVAGRPLSPARDRGLRRTPNPPRAHPGAAAPVTLARGPPGQRLAAHAPLCRRAATQAARPDSHVSGAPLAFAPNHSQTHPPPGLASAAPCAGDGGAAPPAPPGGPGPWPGPGGGAAGRRGRGGGAGPLPALAASSGSRCPGWLRGLPPQRQPPHQCQVARAPLVRPHSPAQPPRSR